MYVFLLQPVNNTFAAPVLVSNYDYLMYLNKLSGRQKGDPSNSAILPWITNFETPNGGLRDLKKSKYRLCKGEDQLNASLYNHVTSKRPSWTSGSCISEKDYDIMNHQQDFMKLCDELCKSVRIYQPQEFPNSVARLYESTPDECIPEFFTDPSVFSSIHPDMSDLGLPPWCSTAEEFIEYHSKLLESDEVSSNLHHWIDLNFGYKVSDLPVKLIDIIYLQNTGWLICVGLGSFSSSLSDQAKDY
ncbi:unnamed protein product [Trichobilharzia regenti]|nr:unnamed protein product [Trichobilharzia regenti]